VAAGAVLGVESAPVVIVAEWISAQYFVVAGAGLP
jgi:hypothetical protein